MPKNAINNKKMMILLEIMGKSSTFAAKFEFK